ncbi:hypothetical protein [Granulicoccus sp. GXG6511]|uniref:hypothetical protein n=1 Tax=Granulicoccus sp. GXG6511 TaxID=3381351 RepID=UPI003D7E1EA7
MRHRSRRRPIWLFLVVPIVLNMLVPAVVAGRLVSGPEVAEVVQRVLSAPLSESVPVLLPIAKGALVAIGILAVTGSRHSPRLLIAYFAVMSVITGLFQNASVLPGTGLAFLAGNAVVQFALAAACLISLGRTAADAAPLRTGRLWAVPLMAFAAAFPYAVVAGHPVPGWDGLLTNGAGVTFCMVTTVVAGALFLRPDAHPAWLRVAVGSVGLLFATWNLLTWFVLSPSGWWMGVLHLPMFICSLALTVTSWRAARHRLETSR